ncbi:hypothetical protein ACWCQZ_49880 [Streptomyces sp. NPDC002285]
MGFVPKKKIYTLEFEDPDMEGLEVKLRGLNTGQLLDLEVKKSAAEREIAEGEDDGHDGAVVDLLQLMADRLVSWNITEEDEVTPVPADMDGIRAQELAFNMQIINAWQQAIAGVPAPLEPGSPDGEASLEGSIPMETLSLPPASTSVPA